LNEAYKSEVWQRFWFRTGNRYHPGEIAGWSEAESCAEAICRIFAEHGITKGKVLDICCGTGRLSTWLAKKGFTAVGLDISALYLREAEKKAREHGVQSNVKFLVGDMRDLDEVAGSESPFDCVINFRNSLGFWGTKVDEMIFSKARKVTRKRGVLIIGECDHLGQLMLNFDKTRVYDSENAVMISEADMNYISGMFTAVFRYYAKKGDDLTYQDSFNYQARVYSVSELTSLLEKVGWKVTNAYESIEEMEPFTNISIFKGSTSMNVVAEAD
jgi:ubiquinone/menaquinone biosynthesis C-methylase UbiE